MPMQCEYEGGKKEEDWVRQQGELLSFSCGLFFCALKCVHTDQQSNHHRSLSTQLQHTHFPQNPVKQSRSVLASRPGVSQCASVAAETRRCI